MARLLYVEASPRKERSHSIAVARAFLDAYRAKNPADTVEEVDVFGGDLPAFGGDEITAIYQVKQGGDVSPEMRSAWEGIQRRAKHFAGFDKYVFSVPMWNFGVPYALKHYIDIVTQPDLTFKIGDSGYEGLCSGPALVVSARGGSYEPKMPGGYDYEAPYMSLWCGFVGLTPEDLLVQPTAAEGPEHGKQMRAEAIEEAKKRAETF